MADVSEPLGLSRSVPSEPKASILLVDDTPANLLSLRAILEDLGQNLVEARSGEEALLSGCSPTSSPSSCSTC